MFHSLLKIVNNLSVRCFCDITFSGTLPFRKIFARFREVSYRIKFGPFCSVSGCATAGCRVRVLCTS